ncbi:unnamed protein product [Didymodactylos carnosus]|uniref:Uncharacterized protein n=1 Tax=Didymodactylos carnosus TaxID=1234261 RepID=A0A815MIC1_9BILA|nr:unnamed protein product [Didymodactylos carnosus]CAF1416799.1 unnamed protein product [Didymodactylos carnosus]CAF3751468.1 unnamed protein product [Didymodactylos carnosus]CAF4302207.1 unnamed protein product [Didymodactylos carnosus]
MTEQCLLPTPPTFSQMMEDLESMLPDDTILKVFSLEDSAEQAENYIQRNENVHMKEIEQACWLIDKFLDRLNKIYRLESLSSSTLNDEQQSTSGENVEPKLKSIIEELERCIEKLQSNNFND